MTPLPRVHLFELEDLAWFPSTIRDLATDYLHYMESRFATHRPVVPLLRDALVQSGATHVVDLCSGGGGPALALHESLLDQGLRVRFLLATPFVRPFLWRRLFFTYLVPLVPLTCWRDGLVSQLRAYTVEELRALTNGLGGGYEWQAGRVPIGHIPGNLTYLIGILGAAE